MTVTNTSGSTISFATSDISYHLPDALDIDPAFIQDDKNEVYRVVIGKPDLTADELAEYKPLFEAIEVRIAKSRFISDICFEVGNQRLTFGIAYVTRTENEYGVMYDIEAEYDEAEYGEAKPVKPKEGKKKNGKTKGKAIQGRKATDKNARK